MIYPSAQYTIASTKGIVENNNKTGRCLCVFTLWALLAVFGGVAFPSEYDGQTMPELIGSAGQQALDSSDGTLPSALRLWPPAQ